MIELELWTQYAGATSEPASPRGTCLDTPTWLCLHWIQWLFQPLFSVMASSSSPSPGPRRGRPLTPLTLFSTTFLYPTWSPANSPLSMSLPSFLSSVFTMTPSCSGPCCLLYILMTQLCNCLPIWLTNSYLFVLQGNSFWFPTKKVQDRCKTFLCLLNL